MSNEAQVTAAAGESAKSPTETAEAPSKAKRTRASGEIIIQHQVKGIWQDCKVDGKFEQTNEALAYLRAGKPIFVSIDGKQVPPPTSDFRLISIRATVKAQTETVTKRTLTVQ